MRRTKLIPLLAAPPLVPAAVQTLSDGIAGVALSRQPDDALVAPAAIETPLSADAELA